MNFELKHALRDLDERTPSFFKLEAVRDDEKVPGDAKETAVAVLSTAGDKNAVRLLKEILRLA